MSFNVLGKLLGGVAGTPGQQNCTFVKYEVATKVLYLKGNTEPYKVSLKDQVFDSELVAAVSDLAWANIIQLSRSCVLDTIDSTTVRWQFSVKLAKGVISGEGQRLRKERAHSLLFLSLACGPLLGHMRSSVNKNHFNASRIAAEFKCQGIRVKRYRTYKCPLLQLPSAIVDPGVLQFLSIKDFKRFRETSKGASALCRAFVPGLSIQLYKVQRRLINWMEETEEQTSHKLPKRRKRKTPVSIEKALDNIAWNLGCYEIDPKLYGSTGNTTHWNLDMNSCKLIPTEAKPKYDKWFKGGWVEADKRLGTTTAVLALALRSLRPGIIMNVAEPKRVPIHRSLDRVFVEQQRTIIYEFCERIKDAVTFAFSQAKWGLSNKRQVSQVINSIFSPDRAKGLAYPKDIINVYARAIDTAKVSSSKMSRAKWNRIQCRLHALLLEGSSWLNREGPAKHGYEASSLLPSRATLLIESATGVHVVEQLIKKYREERRFTKWRKYIYINLGDTDLPSVKKLSSYLLVVVPDTMISTKNPKLEAIRWKRLVVQANGSATLAKQQLNLIHSKFRWCMSPHYVKEEDRIRPTCAFKYLIGNEDNALDRGRWLDRVLDPDKGVVKRCVAAVQQLALLKSNKFEWHDYP